MKRNKTTMWTLWTLLLVLLPGLHFASPAAAGDYPIRQCLGSAQSGFSGDYFQMNTLDRVDVVRGCVVGGANKIGIYQDRSGKKVQSAGGGQFMWSPVPGLQIVGTTFTAKLRDANGIKASLGGPSAQWGPIVLDEGLPHDGTTRTTRWSGEVRRPDLIVVRLRCEWANGCPNEPGGQKAFVEVFDMEIRSRDVAPPRLTPSGLLWDRLQSGGWFRGPAAFRIEAYDPGSGVAGAGLEVNGFEVDLGQVTCPADRGAYATSFTPCPSNFDRSGSVDTTRTPFREGWNSVRYCVSDFAIPVADSNRTCSQTQWLAVDNEAPLPPVGLEVLGGSGWRAGNGFEFAWTLPPGQTSPIAAAEYRLVNTDTGIEVSSGTVPGPAPVSAGPLDAPGPGEYRVEFRLRDEAGNLGSPASATIRFDDSPPGNVAPEEPSGWISEDELPLEQPIERATAGGPSGVDGYAVAVSSDHLIHPCGAVLCDPGDMALTAGPDSRVAVIDRLPEGSNWISSVAASGARLSSREPGGTVVMVDRTDPETSLSGVPDRWVNRPVTLTARAADALSGMSPVPGADDGMPVTVIAPDGQTPYETPGPLSTFTIAAEGTTRVSFWARDLAGNLNDGRPGPDGKRHRPPGTATVRIDTTPPTLMFGDGQDPAEPEAVVVEVKDSASGLDYGQIQIRRIGGDGPFVSLPTTVADGRLRASIPSDDLPAGTYELRAEATDRAGNTGQTVSKEGGSAMVLELPLKRRVEVSLFHRDRKAKERSVLLKQGKGTTLVGQIRDDQSAGMAAAGLTVEERFADGSRRSVRTTGIFADGTGRFSVRLRPGPNREVRVLYDGTASDGRAASRWLRVSSRAGVALKVSPKVLRNGGRTVMRGTVKGLDAIQPAGGKLVAIQYFDPSRSRWRPVEVLRANRSGRFRYSYRFRTIASAQRILFRAVSLPEAGWPYRPSTSGPRSVIVYPRGSSSSR